MLRILQGRHPQCGWLSGIMDRVDVEVLQRCYHLVSSCVDVELSKQSNQTCLKEGFDDELDDLRSKWDDVDVSLSAFLACTWASEVHVSCIARVHGLMKGLRLSLHSISSLCRIFSNSRRKKRSRRSQCLLQCMRRYPLFATHVEFSNP